MRLAVFISAIGGSESFCRNRRQVQNLELRQSQWQVIIECRAGEALVNMECQMAENIESLEQAFIEALV